jgi:hypothetical protein
MTDKPTLEDFASYNYDPETYWVDLEEALGATPKTKTEELSDDALLTLGKAVVRESKRLNHPEEAAKLELHRSFQEIEKEQPTEVIKEDKETILELVDKIADVAYLLRHEMSQKDPAYPELRAETYHWLREIVLLTEKYQDTKFADLWKAVAISCTDYTQCWRGDTWYLRTWAAGLRDEWDKRQPGYAEREAQRRKDYKEWNPDELADALEGHFDGYPDDYDHDKEMLEDAYRESQHTVRVLQSLLNRYDRIMPERIAKAEGYDLAVYQDQLLGLVEQVNEEWANNVDRLIGEGDVVGAEVTVYFNGPHPKQTLAKRYREDLQGAANWKMVVKKKVKGNTYVLKNVITSKEYLMCIGKDKRGHIFAYNFLSFEGQDWIDAERAISPPTSQDSKKKTYDFYQVYDKCKAYCEEKKKKGRRINL